MVYYADSTMCESTVDYSRDGFPQRDNDQTSQMKPWTQPFILMVDRGGCTFVKKVRNAQQAGATAVIIADKTCQCDAGNACRPNNEEEMCELLEPIMADDVSAGDITIPSMLMLKQDADLIKETLMEKSTRPNGNGNEMATSPKGFSCRI